MGRGQAGKKRSNMDVKLGGGGATTGYEAELWRMADTLRGNMPPNTSTSSSASSSSSTSPTPSRRCTPVSRRSAPKAPKYADIPGFCKSAALEEVRKHGHVLTPGRYVGTERQDERRRR